MMFTFEAFAYVGAFVAGYFLLPFITRAVATALNKMESKMNTLVLIDHMIIYVFVIAVLLAFYFIPYAIAANRHHQNAKAILMLNLFLGWTFLGWVAALVWSMTEVRS